MTSNLYKHLIITLFLNVVLMQFYGCDNAEKRSIDFYQRYNGLNIRTYEGFTIVKRQSNPFIWGWLVYHDDSSNYGVFYKIQKSEFYYQIDTNKSSPREWKKLSKGCDSIKGIPLSVKKVKKILSIFNENKGLYQFNSVSPCMYTFEFDNFNIEVLKNKNDSCLHFMNKNFNRIEGGWFYD